MLYDLVHDGAVKKTKISLHSILKYLREFKVKRRNKNGYEKVYLQNQPLRCRQRILGAEAVCSQ